MKKICSLVLTVVMLLSMSSIAYAASSEPLIPLWDCIYSMTNNLTFTGTDGKATAQVRGMANTTSISGTLTVYKQVGSDWEYVGSDSDSTSSRSLVLQVEFDGESGAYYKSVFDVSVTCNGIVEPETKTDYETCP